MSTQFIILWTLGICMSLMALSWTVAKKINNYSIVDAIWSLSFALLSIPLFVFGQGFFYRKLIICSMFFVWSMRLGSYLAVRIFGHLDQEDTRYIQLRKDYGNRVAFRFFLFFQFQALSIPLLLAPLFVSVQNTDELLHPLEFLGLLVWLVGLIGETVSDSQMKRFKSDPLNKGKVCNIGLWNYSRHPNYFFEAVIWLGYGIFALASPWGIVAFYAPVIMWILLTKVTGIPYAEAQSLKSRGDAYREYQKRVSAFFPLPPKRF